MSSDKIHLNQVLASRLGWTPSDFGAFAFDQHLVNLITAQQELLGGLEADGVAGAKTYAAHIVAKQAFLIAHPSSDRLLDAGVIALYECLRLWLSDVTDLPPKGSPAYERSWKTIDDLIRTDLGIDWDWEDPYDSDYEWCGTLPAAGWRKAGLRRALRQSFFPSNYRLDRYARYKPLERTPNPKPAEGPYRMIIELDETSRPEDCVFPDGTKPRGGDIMTMGPVNSAYGKHISLVERFDDIRGWFHTVEGNGTGVGPDGDKRHGIVRAVRTVGLQGASAKSYHARRVIRPALSDLIL